MFLKEEKFFLEELQETVLSTREDVYKRQIEILAASGIGAKSIEKLLPYTGITSYHMSGKIVVDSAMEYRKEGIGLGLSERGDYALWQTSEEEIVKAVKVLKTTG